MPEYKCNGQVVEFYKFTNVVYIFKDANEIYNGILFAYKRWKK